MGKNLNEVKLSIFVLLCFLSVFIYWRNWKQSWEIWDYVKELTSTKMLLYLPWRFAKDEQFKEASHENTHCTVSTTPKRKLKEGRLMREKQQTNEKCSIFTVYSCLYSIYFNGKLWGRTNQFMGEKTSA